MSDYGTHVCDVTVDSIVATYLDLIAEGQTPDLEEFISRVPEDLQEEVFLQIDAATANPPEVENNFFLEPSVELRADALPKAGFEERLMLRMVPAAIRENFSAEWLLTRRAGSRAIGEWLQALAQHAPLREKSLGNEPDRVSQRGRVAWRTAGPALFTGVVFGLPVVVICGAVLLALAITAATTRRSEDDEVSRNLINAVLGGATVGLAAVLLFGLLTVLAITLSVVFGWPVLAAAAVKALAVSATFVAAIITGSGWSPEPWWPKHLLRQD